MEYLRPKEIAQKLGISHKLTSKLIRASKCQEQREEGQKTLFCYENIVEFIKLEGHNKNAL